ncbi:hypothetical protein KCN56_10195 [Photobacterium galatheae]|uniref:F0F1 ATP synthase subunit epsilon n=1 Tax=Photobacterium galatheae TaxID=1654360 RepID=UPI00202CF382|nr:hypothetical protein [Photobacterium galatheae]MCM0148934.1 hypothetical protein [Photobacterium galatheae]
MPFQIQLFDNQSDQVIDAVQSFVGEDASGSFCILSGHDYFMTILCSGLATVTLQASDKLYLAIPGGFLHFQENVLSIHTRHCWQGRDYLKITEILQTYTDAENESLHKIKTSLGRIEESMMRRIMDLERNP